MSRPDLLRIVSRFDRFRVLVVGDLMLDRYVWGDASRISQEAPVPVVCVRRETMVPGGAANVVRNVLALGGQASVFGVVGNDEDGRSLTGLLGAAGADIRGVVAAANRPTTVKTRILASSQQIVRIDREETAPVDANVIGQLEAGIAEALEQGQANAVIFEDYAKGLFTAEFMQRVADLARRRQVFTALDPHPGHPFNVRGLGLMTPNRSEAFGLAGVYYRPTILPIDRDEDLIEVGRRLRRQWEVGILLVTLGAGGMALFSGEGVPLHIPTRAREVFDVSGAGDTVIASYALARLAGGTVEEAAQIANHAAGIVVGKVGTAPCPAQELADDLNGDEQA